jgi:hypothetical protein
MKYDITRHFCVVLGLLAAAATIVVVLTVFQGGHVARVAIQVAWIATAVVVLPLFAQILVGDKGLQLPADDFLLATAILYTLSMSLFQHGLLFFEAVV